MTKSLHPKATAQENNMTRRMNPKVKLTIIRLLEINNILVNKALYVT